jgi:hypothetical protein
MKLTVTQTMQFKREYYSRFSLAAALIQLGTTGPKKRFSSIIFRYRNPNEHARSFKLHPGTKKELATPDALLQLSEEILKHDDIDPLAEVELILNFL